MARADVVGSKGPRFQVPIERGKIREFARATMSDDAAYLDAAAAPIPPTFLVTMAFWQPPDADRLFEKLEIDPARLLHGGQEYEFFGPPPHAGDELTAQTSIESVVEKEGRRGGTMTFAVLTTDFTDRDGNLVARARTTAIETAHAPEAS